MARHKLGALAKPLSVLHIASGDLWGGAEYQLVELLKGLKQYPALRLKVIVLNEGQLTDAIRRLGLQAEIIDEARLGLWRQLRLITKAASRFEPDLVHSHRLKENLMAALLARRLQQPLVRTAHGLSMAPGGQPTPLKRRVAVALDQHVAKRVRGRTVCVSRELKRRIPLPPGKLEDIPNCVDPAHLRAQALEADPLGQSGSRVTRIGIVGRLVPVKRQDLFLDIAEALLKRRPRAFQFYIIGDGPLRPALQARIERQGLVSAITLTGFQANIPSWLKRLDLLVSVSDHEGMPINLLEAIALRVPIIAHRTGGIPEILPDERYARLIPSQDPEDFLEAILEYRDGPSPFHRKAENAFSERLPYFEHRECARRHLELYLSLKQAHRQKQPSGPVKHS